MFTPEQPDQLHDLTNSLRHHDRFLVCADFDAYVACQDKEGVEPTFCPDYDHVNHSADAAFSSATL
ncbi:hypothetical protein KIN20_003363 [Parelaphostrongylus tenuis]|uniref:Uncharacterized protein n=1 Tax=Parelaphostrongylus tenuis TaxID=148309 RepID=A0AAD5QEA4_PARTN|nr:hypothetical protein KIN20_003363 [Parelaphostrongylus tenuis]